MGKDLAGPDFFWKLFDRASEIESAMDGFSATIMTEHGVFTLSVLGPFA